MEPISLVFAFIVTFFAASEVEDWVTGEDECNPVKEQCDCQYSHYHKKEWCDWVEFSQEEKE